MFRRLQVPVRMLAFLAVLIVPWPGQAQLSDAASQPASVRTMAMLFAAPEGRAILMPGMRRPEGNGLRFLARSGRRYRVGRGGVTL